MCEALAVFFALAASPGVDGMIGIDLCDVVVSGWHATVTVLVASAPGLTRPGEGGGGSGRCRCEALGPVPLKLGFDLRLSTEVQAYKQQLHDYYFWPSTGQRKPPPLTMGVDVACSHCAATASTKQCE